MLIYGHHSIHIYYAAYTCLYKCQVLQGIANATANKKGTYVFAQGDKKSIDDAFSQVATLIQGTLVMEDM